MTEAELMAELQTHVAQLKADLAKQQVKKQGRRWPRLRLWDCRYQYRPERGFRPRFGKVLELWMGPWGEPRFQIALEAGHRRFWHRPRVYDLNSDCTQ